MTTVLITVVKPSRSYVVSEIKKFIPSSCNLRGVWDVLGDVDNMIEVPLAEWGHVKQILTDEIGGGISMKHFFTWGREILNGALPGNIQVFTFLRLVRCEEKMYPAMVLDGPGPSPSPGVVMSTYDDKKSEIETVLQNAKDTGEVANYQISCGYGIGFPPGILIEGFYKNVFGLKSVIETLHKELNHEVKTISYVSMRI